MQIIDETQALRDIFSFKKIDERRISVDFVVDDYENFKNKINNPVIKKYDTFELIQFKNDDSIINVISLSAKEDYKVGE